MKVEAFIRVNRLEELRLALEERGLAGMTCESVRGYGRQQGRTDTYRGSTYALNLLPKTRVEIALPEDEAETAIEAILEVCRTGELGDGKIFVSELLDAVRVRTGERGADALA